VTVVPPRGAGSGQLPGRRHHRQPWAGGPEGHREHVSVSLFPARHAQATSARAAHAARVARVGSNRLGSLGFSAGLEPIQLRRHRFGPRPCREPPGPGSPIEN